MSLSHMRGVKFGSLSVSGSDAFGRLRLESGVHRVQVLSLPVFADLFVHQRVPLTEKQGRVQTSAASVVVLEQPDDVSPPTLVGSTILGVGRDRTRPRGSQN